MAIKLEKELRAVKKELEALSKKIDRIAAGIGKTRKAKPKAPAKKTAGRAVTDIAVVPEMPASPVEPDPAMVISEVAAA